MTIVLVFKKKIFLKWPEKFDYRTKIGMRVTRKKKVRTGRSRVY